jgi:hypothetical protein
MTHYANATAGVAVALFTLVGSVVMGAKASQHQSDHDAAMRATITRNGLCNEHVEEIGNAHCNGFIVLTKGKSPTYARLTAVTDGTPQGVVWTAGNLKRELGSSIDDCMDISGTPKAGCEYIRFTDTRKWSELNGEYLQRLGAYTHGR